jgi:hypothetical protein
VTQTPRTITAQGNYLEQKKDILRELKELLRKTKEAGLV